MSSVELPSRFLIRSSVGGEWLLVIPDNSSEWKAIGKMSLVKEAIRLRGSFDAFAYVQTEKRSVKESHVMTEDEIVDSYVKSYIECRDANEELRKWAETDEAREELRKDAEREARIWPKVRAKLEAMGEF